MRIYTLDIENFRGIKALSWVVKNNVVALIGKCDSGKTTILNALHYLLYPNNGLSVSDLDFHNCDTSEPISITATIGFLPDELLTEFRAGLHLRGITPEGTLRDEPEEDDIGVVTIRLIVDNTLDPLWTLVTDRTSEGTPIGLRVREKLASAWLSSYVDSDFTLMKGTVLHRSFADVVSPDNLLKELKRSIKASFSSGALDTTNMNVIAAGIESTAKEFGVKANNNLSFNLDIKNQMGTSAIFSLFDGDVPARLKGLGSKRLLSLSIQNSNVDSDAITLIDEIEHGLEPHRVRNLIRLLRNKVIVNGNEVGQVFLTTHSSVAVTELLAPELHVVNNNNGIVTVTPLDKDLQDIARSAAEALLARNIIVCEGRTEIGLFLALDDWFKSKGKEQFSYLSVDCVDGQSDDVAVVRAEKLHKIGFRCSLIIDADKPSLQSKIDALRTSGIDVFQWDAGFSIEQQVLNDVSVEAIQKLVDMFVDRFNEQSVFDSIKNALPPSYKSKLTADTVKNLLSLIPETALRSSIAAASKKQRWFKPTPDTIDFSKKIFDVVLPDLENRPTTTLYKNLDLLEQWVCTP